MTSYFEVVFTSQATTDITHYKYEGPTFDLEGKI